MDPILQSHVSTSTADSNSDRPAKRRKIEPFSIISEIVEGFLQMPTLLQSNSLKSNLISIAVHILSNHDDWKGVLNLDFINPNNVKKIIDSDTRISDQVNNCILEKDLKPLFEPEGKVEYSIVL